MKVILITGNGFNYFVKEIIKRLPDDVVRQRAEQEKSEILKEISSIIELWKEFDEIFNNIKSKIGEKKLTDEEIIRMLHSAFDLLSNFDIFKKILSSDQISSIKVLFDRLLLDNIKKVSEKFVLHQYDNGYQKIRNLIPNFGEEFNNFKSKNNIVNFHSYTTNYDGIIDALFSTQEKKYLLSDCFIYSDLDNYLNLIPDFVDESDRLLMAHLHGSYLYEKIGGKTYKQKNAFTNNFPVMIFNNPDLKRKFIIEDSVLSIYFKRLEDDLKTYDRLIILGNSLENEPHIKNLINRYFNRLNTKILICLPDPNKAGLENIYDYDIEAIPMTEIDTPYKLFDQISNRL